MDHDHQLICVNKVPTGPEAPTKKLHNPPAFFILLTALNLNEKLVVKIFDTRIKKYWKRTTSSGSSRTDRSCNKKKAQSRHSKAPLDKQSKSK